MIAVFALIFAISFARKRSAGVALGLFMGLTYFMGWEIGPLIHSYMRTIGPAIVFQAAVTTGLGMAAMGCVAYLFNINNRKVTGIGTALLIGVVLLGHRKHLLPLPVAGYLLVDDPGCVHAADHRRFCPHPRRWRRAVGGVALARSGSTWTRSTSSWPCCSCSVDVGGTRQRSSALTIRWEKSGRESFSVCALSAWARS